MSPSARRSPVATIAACTAVAALTVVAAHGLSQLQLSLRPEVQSVLTSKPIGNAECRQQLMGPIETTNCDYEDLEKVNEDLFENLHSLVTRPFFKYFHVDLYRDCPFWEENTMCRNENCGVASADESEIPEKWRVAALSAVEKPAAKLSLPGCYYRDTDFCFLDDEKEGGEYVDLSLNPERFTGYTGDSARRVWSSIYNENCFGVSELASGGSPLVKTEPALSTLDDHSDGGQCLEKRVYYRVVSGLHASISTHICWENMIDQTRGEWGPDLGCFIDRVASNPERLQNIYFNTVLMLRALSRIKPYLSAYDMCSGDTSIDDLTKGELNTVLNLAERVGRFDEGLLFRGEHAVHKEEFKEHFRNVSRIMDCVGCDKCRLWGKVQITGVATALKILFELDESALSPTANPNLLQRSELVAFINTLHRFSESLYAADFFRKEWAKMEADEEKPAAKPAMKVKVNPSSGHTEEGANDSTPRTVPPTTSPAPSTPVPNATLFDTVCDAVSARVSPIVKACEKGTAACVELVSNALGSLASLFQSSKYDGPGREL